MLSRSVLYALSAMVVLALVLSGLAPYDRATWLLEVAPVLIAAPILVRSYHRFPLTGLLYVLIALHALVLIGGGTHTYARVPAGFWVQDLLDLLDLSRNPYDKLGHFMQGLVPTLLTREILLRMRFLSSRAMTGFLSVCVAMAFSAFYELIEWWAALLLGQGADEFLGTQGDPWDTQSDMFLAMLGGLCALSLFARWQDRQMRRLQGSQD